MTLTELLRKSDGSREDDSESDSDDETRATKCGDCDETGGGREDGLNLGSDERACTYIGGTNYVALTREGRGT